MLDDADFAWLTGALRTLADRHARGRVVSMLEGGYDLQALAECSIAHVRVLLQQTTLNLLLKDKK
ncbi:hypothetical protein XFF6991_4907 [Xanthomonas phaseoli pv. phaseoli]|nr:hypothetical protein XFF6991_4907 [Xanthomonas phaseoli pv. phaseoli]